MWGATAKFKFHHDSLTFGLGVKPPNLKTINISSYRPYAIWHHHSHIQMWNGERKFGYYAAILSGKNDSGLQSLSTAEQLASSFLTTTESDLHLHQEYARSQQALTLTEANKLTCMPCWRSELTKCFTVLKHHRLRSSFPLKMVV